MLAGDDIVHICNPPIHLFEFLLCGFCGPSELGLCFAAVGLQGSIASHKLCTTQSGLGWSKRRLSYSLLVMHAEMLQLIMLDHQLESSPFLLSFTVQANAEQAVRELLLFSKQQAVQELDAARAEKQGERMLDTLKGCMFFCCAGKCRASSERAVAGFQHGAGSEGD